jgi:hypothetical protein
MSTKHIIVYVGYTIFQKSLQTIVGKYYFFENWNAKYNLQVEA